MRDGRSFTIAANQGAMGGGEVMLLAIAEAARNLGREVTIVGPADPPELVEGAKQRGFRVVSLPGGTAGYLRNLRAWDKRHRRGLLWCNGLRPALATAGHRDRVVELHQRPEGRLKAVARIATRGVPIVVPSHSMASVTPRARVLWNWSDPVVAVQRRVRSEDDPVTVGFLGRLSSDKGVTVLCEAMAELERSRPGRFRLLLAGESRFVSDDDAQRVADAIAVLGDRVEHRGWIPRHDFFQAVDVAVFPSVWPESFGLVVTEAMSARVPFVVSDAGALPEVAGAGYPYTAAAGDSVSLADALERVAVPNNQVHANWQRWATHFSPEAGQRRLADLLDELDPASPPTERQPRIGLAHDYLTQRGGAERVTLVLAQAFPEATLTTALYEPAGTYPEFAAVRMRTTWLNRFPALRSSFRLGLPFFGLGFSTTAPDPAAEVVIASSTAFAHGVRTAPGVPKIVYCHSPARFLYLVDDYLGGPWWKRPAGWALMALRPALVSWDQRAARSADLYLCNSTVVRERIREVYGIDAKVVHPPAALDPTGEQEPIPLAADAPRGFHLVVSRLMPYKNVDVVIEAFRALPERHLLVIGKGPLSEQLRADLPPNVTMTEGVSDAQMRWAYARAMAVIAPSFEDFGLTPVEGLNFGTPTLALRAGGYLDTVTDGVTGYYFDTVSPEAIREAVRRLDSSPLVADQLQQAAERFSPGAFVAQIRAVVAEQVDGARSRSGVA